MKCSVILRVCAIYSSGMSVQAGVDDNSGMYMYV